MATSHLLPGLSCGLLAAAVFWLTATCSDLFWGDRPCQESLGSFEFGRRQQLRQQSWAYRSFEPLLDEVLAGTRDSSLDVRQQNLAAAMKLSPEYAHWTTAEFLATGRVEAFVVAVGIFALVAPTGFVLLAAAMAISVGATYPALRRQAVHRRADLHLKRVRQRLPFVVDQMALMMEAGASFEECLQTIVQQNPQHPLTEELCEVQRQIELGRSRIQALQDLKHRLQDPDIADWIFALNQGDELGTPMSATLLTQAEQMRLKRAQRGEKAAAEAEVQIVFPGMLVMVACLLIIVAPLLLPALITFLE